jgi:hypothetical protein
MQEDGAKYLKGPLFTDLFLSSFLHFLRSRVIAFIDSSGVMRTISLRHPAEGRKDAAPFSFDPRPKNVKMYPRPMAAFSSHSIFWH